MNAPNMFYDLPVVLQCVIYEKCGKDEWSDNIKKVHKSILKKKKMKEFSEIVRRSRTDMDALMQMRTFWSSP